MALRIKGGPQKRQQEARDCLSRLEEWQRKTNFGDYISRLKLWDTQWRGTIPRTNPPWDHASEYNPPLTFSKVEDIHSVIFGFFSGFDFFQMGASAKKGLAEEIMRKRAQDWTDLLRWSMMNESNSLSFLDRFIHDGVLYGVAFGYMPWLREMRNMQSEVLLPAELRRDESIPDEELIKAGLADRLLSNLEQYADGRYKVTIMDHDGEEKTAKAWTDRENPFHPDGEAVLLVERDWTFYDAPNPMNVAPWDMLIPQDVSGLQRARRFWHRQFLDYNDIARFAKTGLFNAISRDELKVLREKSKSKQPAVSTISVGDHDAVDSQRDYELGMSKMLSREDQYEVFFEYCMEDVDGDGFNESIVRAVLHYRAPILLMRHRLEYLYPHGRRPSFDWHLVPIDDRYYGMGVPEVLEMAQREENAWYQTRSDVLEIITKPGGMYDPMSGFSPDEIKYLPGMFVKARDPRTAMQPFVFPTDPGHLIREQSGIDLQAERAVGSTDMGLGRGPTRPNAPRTLGGTAIQVRQQQLRTDVFLKRAMYGSGDRSSGVAEFLQQYRDLYASLMPPVKEFRAVGSDELRQVNREELQGRYDFIVDFGPEVNNPQMRMQQATLRYQNSLNNPLIMRDLNTLYEVTADFWEATGKASARKILPRPEPAATHPPMDQQEENIVLSKGVYIEPLLVDNHADHLRVIAEAMAAPETRAAFTEMEIPLLERHVQQHMAMIQAQMGNQGNNGNRLAGGEATAMRGVGQNPFGEPSPGETIASPIEQMGGEQP